MITQRDRVIALPRKPTVASILDDYLSCKKKHDRVLTEVVEAIRLYFDRALGTVLLYRSERSQFEKTLHDAGSKVPMSQLYGAEHLLRLFGACSSCSPHVPCQSMTVERACAVKLPGLLGQADFSDTSEVQAVQARLGDILKYVAARAHICMLASDADKRRQVHRKTPRSVLLWAARLFATWKQQERQQGTAIVHFVAAAEASCTDSK